MADRKAPRSRPAATQRPRPYDPEKDQIGRQNEGGTVEAEDGTQFETPANSLKVAGTTDVRELAATVRDAARIGDIPALLTIGNTSINQAVKGIAAARQELRDECELTFQPAFRHTNRTKPLIAFYIARARTYRVQEEPGEPVELTVASNCKIVALAGAIAGKVREHKKVSMVAIGVDAVTNAVLAIGNARLFLEGNQLDIKASPEFVKLNKNGVAINGVKFNIISERI